MGLSSVPWIQFGPLCFNVSSVLVDYRWICEPTGQPCVLMHYFDIAVSDQDVI